MTLYSQVSVLCLFTIALFYEIEVDFLMVACFLFSIGSMRAAVIITLLILVREESTYSHQLCHYYSQQVRYTDLNC